MGYPNKRVSMTDVHGEPQQGGYLPAEIWHAYMSSVEEGKSCVPFPTPKETISYKPFYGKFATTGESRATTSESEHEELPSKSESAHKHSIERTKAGGRSAPPSAPPPPNGGPAEPGTGGAGPG